MTTHEAARGESTCAVTTTVVIFGATGDLAARLLYPGLYRLETLGLLDTIRFVGLGLETLTQAEFLDHLERSVGQGDDDRSVLECFLRRWSYSAGDLTPEAVAELAPLMSETNIHYLALPPGMFTQAATSIATCGITNTGNHRLVVENHSAQTVARRRRWKASFTSVGMRNRSFASITSSARKRCRTSRSPGSPIESSNRCCAQLTSIRSRSRWAKRSGSRVAIGTTTASGPSETSRRTSGSQASGGSMAAGRFDFGV